MQQQQLQLHLPSDEQIALNPAVQEQLVELMAEVMQAVIARESVTRRDLLPRYSHDKFLR